MTDNHCMPGKKNLQLYLNSLDHSSSYAQNSACQPQGFTREVLKLPLGHSAKAPGSLNTTAIQLASITHRRKLKPSQWLHRALKVVAMTNAVLAVGVSVLGFAAVMCEEQVAKDVLKVCVGLVSVVQIGLVVLHSRLLRRWRESSKQELSCSAEPTPPLKWCNTQLLLERLLYTIIPIPGVTYHWSLGQDFVLSLDCVLYTVLLLRNYFTVWTLFWLSDLSTRRVQLLTKVLNVKIWPGFGLRYYLYLHYLPVVGVISALTTLLCGVILTLFDPYSSHLGISSLGNSLWLAVSAESRTGYSDILPQTAFSRILILLTWATGCFSLFLLPRLLSRQLTMSRAQTLLYAELAFAHYKRGNREAAVLRIQTWWRLVAMRRRHVLDAETLVNSCKQQAKYRKFLQTGHTVQDRGLAGHMEAFQSSICSKLQKINAGFRFILSVQVLVTPIQATNMVQTQYSIMHQAKAFARHSLPHKGKPHLSLLHQSPPHQTVERRIANRKVVFTEAAEVGRAGRKARQRQLWGLLKGTAPTPVVSWADRADSRPAFS